MPIVSGRQRLAGLHPDLVRVIERAARDIDLAVVEGVRTLARQRELVASGASRTLNSRHIPAKNGLGHAIDIYPVTNTGKVIVNWNDDPRGTPASDRKANGPFTRLNRAVVEAAKVERVPLEWGGAWKGFPDGPHYQLPWASYPGDGPAPEVAKFAKMVKGGLEGVNSKPLTKSRTVAGSTTAGVSGVMITAQAATEAADALQKADGHLSAGTIIGLVAGLVIIAGAGLALYARWRDGGGLFPWERT